MKAVLQLKRLQFVNEAAQEETRHLPPSIRKAVGFQLQRVQRGDMPTDFKPMKSVGAGVYEIRVDDELGNNVGRCFLCRKVWRYPLGASFVRQESAENAKERYRDWHQTV